MSVNKENNLTLVQISDSQSKRRYQETLLAESMGNDLYEIKSIPRFTNEVNYKDIVRAAVLTSDTYPIVSEVVIKSGFRTIRIAFNKIVAEKEQREILYSLQKQQTIHETICEGFYVLNVFPNGNTQSILNYLLGLKNRGYLLFEPDVSLEEILLIGFS
jgi:hypothetical protein